MSPAEVRPHLPPVIDVIEIYRIGDDIYRAGYLNGRVEWFDVMERAPTR
jgi:hypothetical protein